jgi:DNA-binding NarL/FixJ family response regulator
MSTRVSVIIAEDHPLFRKGLKDAINEDPSLHLAGEADNGVTALELIERDLPHVAVLDIDMPRMNGLNVARAVQEKNLPVATVILTVYKEEDMFNEALEAGVRGYVVKDSAVIDLLDALKAVTMGKYYFSPSLSGYLLARNRRTKELVGQVPALQNLTPSEQRILKLIAQSKSSKEIAESLNISYRTVETHRTNIATKLSLHGPNSLLKFALEHKSSFG